ncbi:uncharacterized protein LOC135225075 [Macrobrachium nipponense]|uniref:uncharacterized protein LOC135225075 n=1 Tax=Macrobrachium nipponense TaxID=159736 RepID=UPI0030C7D045
MDETECLIRTQYRFVSLVPLTDSHFKEQMKRTAPNHDTTSGEQREETTRPPEGDPSAQSSYCGFTTQDILHSELIIDTLFLSRATRLGEQQHQYAGKAPLCRTSQFQRSFVPRTIGLECEKFHNGVCKLRQDSGSCDYTLDICPRTDSNWLCTCCASCDGEASNNCKANGGHCRRSCAEEEVYAFWHDCAKGDCRCCKECLQSTCAEGRVSAPTQLGNAPKASSQASNSAGASMINRASAASLVNNPNAQA